MRSGREERRVNWEALDESLVELRLLNLQVLIKRACENKYRRCHKCGAHTDIESQGSKRVSSNYSQHRSGYGKLNAIYGTQQEKYCINKEKKE